MARASSVASQPDAQRRRPPVCVEQRRSRAAASPSAASTPVAAADAVRACSRAAPCSSAAPVDARRGCAVPVSARPSRVDVAQGRVGVGEREAALEPRARPRPTPATSSGAPPSSSARDRRDGAELDRGRRRVGSRRGERLAAVEPVHAAGALEADAVRLAAAGVGERRQQRRDEPGDERQPAAQPRQVRPPHAAKAKPAAPPSTASGGPARRTSPSVPERGERRGGRARARARRGPAPARAAARARSGGSSPARAGATAARSGTSRRRAAAGRRRSAAARGARRPPGGPARARPPCTRRAAPRAPARCGSRTHALRKSGWSSTSPDRLGVVDRRRREHLDAVRRQRVDGGLQVRAPVADVGAEPEVALAAHAGSSRTSASWRDWAISSPDGVHSSPSSSHTPPTDEPAREAAEHVVLRRHARRRAAGGGCGS